MEGIHAASKEENNLKGTCQSYAKEIICKTRITKLTKREKGKGSEN